VEADVGIADNIVARDIVVADKMAVSVDPMEAKVDVIAVDRDWDRDAEEELVQYSSTVDSLGGVC